MKPWLFLAAAALAAGQDFTQRGFLETTGLLFPETAPNDSGHATAEALFRYEAFYKLTPDLHLAGGIDLRTDTHLETERAFGLSWWDRSSQRPAFAIRRLSVTYTHGKLTVEAGKQFVRWGKTDILNPTDRFAPRDFLNVVDNDFLAITAARVLYGTQANTIEVVVSPRLTPSRVPLLDERWAVLPAGVPITEQPAAFPEGRSPARAGTTSAPPPSTRSLSTTATTTCRSTAPSWTSRPSTSSYNASILRCACTEAMLPFPCPS